MGWKDTIKPAQADQPKSWRDTITSQPTTSGVNVEDSFAIKAGDAALTQAQMLSDAVVNGVDSIPGVGYLKKGMAAVAAPIKGQTYDETIGGYNQDTDERWDRNPVASLTGSVLFGGKIPGSQAKTISGRIAENVGVGAVDTLGRGEAGLNTDNVAPASAITLGANLATELPGITGRVAKGVKTVTDKIDTNGIADKLDGFAQNKAVKSLEPILSQQERLDKRDMVQKLGKAMLDNKVVKFGSSVDDMLPRVEKMLADKGEAIGAARQKADELGGRVDLRELQKYADDLVEKSKGMGSDAEAYAAAVAKEVEGISVNPIRSMNDTSELLGNLGKSGKYNRMSAPVKAEAVQDVRGKVKALMDEDLANVDKNLFDKHSQDREIFSLLKAGEEILDKSTARGAKNASLGLRDTIFSAAGIAKGGTLSESTITGLALALASKLGRERGNASAAVIAKKLADFVRSSKAGSTPGSSFNGGNTLSDLGDFAAQKAVRYGAEQAYTAATGEESAPDPMKDKIVQVMTDKYNLSEQEQKVLRRLLPGVYDMAGMVKGGKNRILPKDLANVAKQWQENPGTHIDRDELTKELFDPKHNDDRQQMIKDLLSDKAVKKKDSNGKTYVKVYRGQGLREDASEFTSFTTDKNIAERFKDTYEGEVISGWLSVDDIAASLGHGKKVGLETHGGESEILARHRLLDDKQVKPSKVSVDLANPEIKLGLLVPWRKAVDSGNLEAVKAIQSQLRKLNVPVSDYENLTLEEIKALKPKAKRIPKP